MSWVRLDDGFVDHPKIAKVGAFGAWLQIQALCYCNRNLTDGFIPWNVARAFAARGAEYTDPDERIWSLGESCGMTGRDVGEVDWPSVLVDARIWEVVPGGYRIHDYDQYQPTKAEVLAQRARNVAKGQRHRTRVSNRVTTPGSNVDPVPVPVPVPVAVPQTNTQLELVGGGNGGRKKTARRAPETPWPEGLTLTEERVAFAERGGLNAKLEWGKFKARAQRDDVRYRNWNGAWEVWCRNASEWAAERQGRR